MSNISRPAIPRAASSARSSELGSRTRRPRLPKSGAKHSTALWPAQNSSQSLKALAVQLVKHRSDAFAHNVVYALVDATLWQRFALTPGENFTLPINATGTAKVTFIALAEINYIPGTYNTPVNPDSDVGLIVDYQSYVSAYAKASGIALSPNYVWLRTRDDASSLASIRSSLPGL